MMKAYEWLDENIAYEVCYPEPETRDSFKAATGFEGAWPNSTKSELEDSGACFTEGAKECYWSVGWIIAEWLAGRHTNATEHHEYHGRGRRFRMCLEALKEANI